MTRDLAQWSLMLLRAFGRGAALANAYGFLPWETSRS
jgi:hypothetical protein